jgi:hypothetical protein
MFAIMLDLQFKSLQVVKILVGYGNAIWHGSKYGLKAMIPFLMTCFDNVICWQYVVETFGFASMSKSWFSF